MSVFSPTKTRTLDLNTVDMASSAGYADNKVLGHALFIPAGREVELRKLLVYVTAAAGASTFIEIVDNTTVVAKIAVSATGLNTAAKETNGSTAVTLPKRIAATSADRVLHFAIDGALDATTELSLEAQFSDPGAS